MRPSPRVFFYVQHLLGIGHLARASRIAAALAADGFEVTVVTGGTPVPGFPGPGVAHVALPEIRSDAGFTGLADGEGRPLTDAFREMRRDLLLAAFRAAAPDIVVTEAFPFGRRQVRFELLPLMEAIHALPSRPRVAASVRDILQERAKPGRDEESASLARTYYDCILVHGDPSFARLEETFPLAAGLADLVAYTGLVAAPLPPPAEDRFDVVVSAGGGAVGGALLAAAAEAAGRLPGSGSWALIGGTNLPQAEYDALAARLPGNAALFRFRRDFVGLLQNARLSVSQAGYNTVCDILGAGCRSVLVPFAAGGETEQGARAERLAALGLARVVEEARLSGPAMTGAVAASLAGPAPPPSPLDLGGAAATARLLRELL
ncbi:MAG: glycosyltransferase family protein [Paracoccaceae bacterium]